MSTDIATQNNNTAGSGRYTSIKGSDLATRKKIFAATTNAESLADHLGETINLRHIIIQPVSTENEKGEVEEFLRTVLVSEEGIAYASGSQGIVLALQGMFDVFGEPDSWPEPLPIKVVEERGKRGYRYMTIKLAEDAAEETPI